jgi:hypothetical protein
LYTDTHPQSNCTPKEGVRNNSNNGDTISCIPPTSRVKWKLTPTVERTIVYVFHIR